MRRRKNLMREFLRNFDDLIRATEEEALSKAGGDYNIALATLLAETIGVIYDLISMTYGILGEIQNAGGPSTMSGTM